MKIIINDYFGIYSVSKKAVKVLGRYPSRTDLDFIALLEERGSVFCSGKLAHLVIATIPDEATDWEISEYDGSESVTYVVDGKLRHCYGD